MTPAITNVALVSYFEFGFVHGFFRFCRTSKRSYGRKRRVNEIEIEQLMARYEPRLVRPLPISDRWVHSSRVLVNMMPLDAGGH